MFKITRKAAILLFLTAALVLGLATTALANGAVIHHVSVGGPDSCAGTGFRPGCDGNFSLTANMYEDGSVSGEYNDRVPPVQGLHGDIDCLVVEGNQAWVSGVIKQGISIEAGEKVDLTGWVFVAKVQDNGTSAKDPPDRISFTLMTNMTPPGPPCLYKDSHINFELYMNDAPQGQVTVR